MDKELNCFVIMPFSETTITRKGREIVTTKEEWDFIFSDWINKAVSNYNLKIKCFRSPSIPGNFVKGIVEDLYNSDIVIADLTGHKPNVYYELGIRHALKNGTIIITQDFNNLPSDLRSYYCFEYAYSNVNHEYETHFQKFKKKIHEHISSIIKRNYNSDNPVSDYLNIGNFQESESIKSNGQIESSAYEEINSSILEDLRAFYVRTEIGYEKILLDDILYSQSGGATSAIIMKNEKRHIIAITLGQVEDFFNGFGFLRVSRYYIVNLRNIERIIAHDTGGRNKWTVLCGDNEIVVSDSKRTELRKILLPKYTR